MTHGEWQERICSLVRQLDMAVSELEDYERRQPDGKHLCAYKYEVTELFERLRERVKQEPREAA